MLGHLLIERVECGIMTRHYTSQTISHEKRDKMCANCGVGVAQPTVDTETEIVQCVNSSCYMNSVSSNICI